MSWRDRLRPDVASMRAYQAEPPGAGIHLDANENPFDLADVERRAVLEALASLSFNRYPDAGVPRLRAILAERFGVSMERLSVGNGSDEFLALLCAVFGAAPDGARPSILIPVPTFSMYALCARPLGFDVHEVPLTPRFEIDTSALVAKVREKQPNLVFLASPNNPTGALVPRECVRACVALDSSIVVVDEAYGAFAQETLLPVLEDGSGAVLLSSLSKMGLASLRLGVLIAEPAIVAEVDKVRLPYNVNALSARAAEILLERHNDALEARVRDVIAERGRLASKLTALGLEVFPSRSNFLLARSKEAQRIAAGLRARGIIVRNLDRPGALAGCLRITVGTPEETDALCQALSAIR